MTDNRKGLTWRMVRDVGLYTLARLALVVALTAAILFVARLIGRPDLPVPVAAIFALIVAMPLGVWVLAPLRRKATAGIAAVDERRRVERDQLYARLRGEEKSEEKSD